MQLVKTIDIDDHDRLTADVLESLTAKLIKPIVRRHLRVSLRPEDTYFENQNALELVADIQASLLAAINLDRNQNGLVNIEAYATTVSHNACCQYLRDKFPVRTNQESALRYFLSHTAGYAVWQDAGKRWLCGYAQWKNVTAIRPAPVDPAAGGVTVTGNNSRQKYTVIVEAVFRTAGAPVFLDELVTHVMKVLGLNERVEIGTGDNAFGDPHSIRSRDVSAHDHLEIISRLRSIWNSVRAMPGANRKALLLNLKDNSGGLIPILPLSGIADISEIAEALELSLEELAAIWETLPWGDLKIAEHMGITRQQVINLRQSARARLLRSMKKP
jgi:hypothetical protein